MRSIRHLGARSAPFYDPPALQAARIRQRASLPEATARAVVALAFPERPDVRPWECVADLVMGSAAYVR